MPTARRAVVVTLVAAATLAAATTAVLLAAPLPVTPVTMPPDDATPEQVVDTYTRALAGHDCATAGALRTEAADASTWCPDVADLRDIRVLQSTSGSGLRASVGVTFDLDWRVLRSDGSMPEGPTTWGYLLERAGTDDPWRIFDEGVG